MGLDIWLAWFLYDTLSSQMPTFFGLQKTTNKMVVVQTNLDEYTNLGLLSNSLLGLLSYFLAFGP